MFRRWRLRRWLRAVVLVLLLVAILGYVLVRIPGFRRTTTRSGPTPPAGVR